MSVSIGGAGATINVGKGGRVRGTFGMPGSGISYEHTFRRPDASPHERFDNGPVHSAPSGTPHSARHAEDRPLHYGPDAGLQSGMADLQALLAEAYEERLALEDELSKLRHRCEGADSEVMRLGRWWRAWFSRADLARARQHASELHADRSEMEDALKQQGVRVDAGLPQEAKRRYDEFCRLVTRVAPMWHVIGHRYDGENRGPFGQTVNRAEARLVFARPAFIPAAPNDSVCTVPCLRSDAGLSLYFFPAFIVVVRGSEFRLLAPHELQILFEGDVQVAEPGFTGPQDEVIGYTWKYANKNGAPDMRYRDNEQIPLVRYSPLLLRANGLDETFLTTEALSLGHWLGVAGWHGACSAYAEMLQVECVPTTWRVRSEEFVHYVVADYGGHEFVGFGFERKGKGVWVGISTEHVGMDLNDCLHTWVGVGNAQFELTGNKSYQGSVRIGELDDVLALLQDADDFWVWILPMRDSKLQEFRVRLSLKDVTALLEGEPAPARSASA